MHNNQVQIKNIPEYFTDKCIFITGASGFIGKVLIEKLLRSCPDVQSIYILIRKKKGKSPQERIKEITNLPLFEKIRDQNKESLNKIIPIIGDAALPDLGISENDKSILISNVNIVFHCAASVRFDDHLKDAILVNVRSTRDLVNLLRQFKQLDVYIHLSTAYCHVDKQVIEEKIYPAQSNWRDAVNIAENLPDQDKKLEAMTLKYIHPFPNTYIYTKSLAENVVDDLCKGNIPAVIYRPSIVGATLSEPFLGWLDNFNGPVGLIFASTKGLCTYMYGDSETVMDHVLVDNVAKSLIAAAWEKAELKTSNHEVTVYNACGDVRDKMWHYYELSERIAWEVPLINRVWYGGDIMFTTSWLLFYTRFILGLIPTFILHGPLKLLGKENKLLKVPRKLYIANHALAYFMLNSWTFRTDKYKQLDRKLLESDRSAFMFYNVTLRTFEAIYEYTKMGLRAASNFLLHETPATQTAYRNTKWFYILDRGLKFICYVLIFYWIFWKCDIISVIINSF